MVRLRSFEFGRNAFEARNETVRELNTRNEHFGRAVDRRVGGEVEAKSARAAVEAGPEQAPLDASRPRAAETGDGAPAGVGIGRIILLVAGKNRQVFLVPTVADPGVVAGRGGRVPLPPIPAESIH